MIQRIRESCLFTGVGARTVPPPSERWGSARLGPLPRRRRYGLDFEGNASLKSAWARLLAIAAIAPLPLLGLLALKGGWALLGAAFIYPVAVAAALIFGFPFHHLILRRGLSPWAQARYLLVLVPVSSCAVFAVMFGREVLTQGMPRGQIETLVSFALIGGAVAGIAWLLYNWGPLRIRPRNPSDADGSDSKS